MNEVELKEKALHNFHYWIDHGDESLSKIMKQIFLMGLECGIEISKQVKGK